MANSNLVIGDEDCPYSRIVKILAADVGTYPINFQTIADGLGVTRVDSQTLAQNRFLGLIGNWELVRQILEKFRGRNGSNAKLSKLLDVLDGIDDMKDAAEKLRKEFGLSVASTSGNTTREGNADVAITPDEARRRQAQKDKINTNLHSLINMTELHPEMIAMFQARGILGDGDITTLSAERNEQAKIQRFYKIIQTRVGYYEVLMEALNATNQTGVAELLKL